MEKHSEKGVHLLEDRIFYVGQFQLKNEWNHDEILGLLLSKSVT